MRAVDLRINAAALADTFEHMRTWLDHERCIPVNFDQAASEPGEIRIRVEFGSDHLADVFCREFGGACHVN